MKRLAVAIVALALLPGCAFVLLPYPRRGGVPDSVRRQLGNAETRLLWAKPISHYPLVGYGIGERTDPPDLTYPSEVLFVSPRGSVLLYLDGKLQSFDIETGGLQWVVRVPRKVEAVRVIEDGKEFLANPLYESFLVRNPDPERWKGIPERNKICEDLLSVEEGDQIAFVRHEPREQLLSVPRRKYFWLLRFRDPGEWGYQGCACGQIILVASKLELAYPGFGLNKVFRRVDVYERNTGRPLWGADVSGGVVRVEVHERTVLLVTRDGWLLVIGPATRGDGGGTSPQRAGGAAVQRDRSKGAPEAERAWIRAGTSRWWVRGGEAPLRGRRSPCRSWRASRVLRAPGGDRRAGRCGRSPV